MGKHRETSPPVKGRFSIKRITLFFLKMIFLTPFFVFGIWLIYIVYFQGLEFQKHSLGRSDKKEEDVFKVLMPKQEKVPRDHFHMIDRYVEPQNDYQPVCVICHGSYAHGKDKRLRAMLNMHEGYIACSVCHVKRDENRLRGTMEAGTRPDFIWVDRKTGELKRTVDGAYGKYSAQIFPISSSTKGAEQIYAPIKMDEAQAFLERLPGLTKEQAVKAREKLHEPISKEAVSCSDCHKTNGYLNFKELGFPQQRVDNLISTEFVGMIEKYKTFHLPSVIDLQGR